MFYYYLNFASVSPDFTFALHFAATFSWSSFACMYFVLSLGKGFYYYYYCVFCIHKVSRARTVYFPNQGIIFFTAMRKLDSDTNLYRLALDVLLTQSTS